VLEVSAGLSVVGAKRPSRRAEQAGREQCPPHPRVTRGSLRRAALWSRVFCHKINRTFARYVAVTPGETWNRTAERRLVVACTAPPFFMEEAKAFTSASVEQE